ncbi:hypothetical protein PIB30_003062 [Stylosanthes scabra]|uniref:Zinc finger GRF-type domain-containing protein n=1 Tax=Stylosanthes scabra TaxID=79078 RepID=A0ABU6X0Q9_9FABA|nr:hypothetical protein [Stylosanthes scabra]
MRGERSLSSTQGCFVAKAGNERDGAAPKCKCGVYAILYLSKTSNNPNQLFFGCPFFKLDQHAAKFGKKEGMKCEEDEEDVNEHFAKLNVDDRLGDLEDRVAAIKRKKSINTFLIVMGFIIALLSPWANRM